MTKMKIKNVWKKCVIKPELKFEDYKHCLEATELQRKKKSTKKNKCG